MSERVHMTAPDGRTFTFEEWCEYLKQPGHNVEDEYIGADGMGTNPTIHFKRTRK